MTFADLANSAIDVYEVQRRHGLDEGQARTVAVDWIREIGQHLIIMEEPECCDALPRVEWLHHSTCPEVQAHYAPSEESHPACLPCAVQKRPVETEPGPLQH